MLGSKPVGGETLTHAAKIAILLACVIQSKYMMVNGHPHTSGDKSIINGTILQVIFIQSDI